MPNEEVLVEGEGSSPAGLLARRSHPCIAGPVDLEGA